jgi:glycosyltransferase involved in cell wall biosynthesis
MHIVLLNDDFPPTGKGGGARIVAELARAYAKLGHTVDVITTHQTGEPRKKMEKDGFRVTSLPIRYPPILRPYLSLVNPRASRLIKETLREIGPIDVIHAHNVHAFLTYGALRIARRHARTVVMTFHDVMSIAYGRLATARYLCSTTPRFDYRVTTRDRWRQAGWSFNPLREWMIRRSLRTVHTRIAVSDALRNCLTTNGVSVDGVIHNGIDVEESRPDSAIVASFKHAWNVGDDPVIFFGGRLSADKGFSQLAHAIDKLPEALRSVRMIVAGDESKARKFLADPSVPQRIRDRVVVTGWLNREEMIAAIAMSDICVTPSVCFDSFPTVNLEAMVLGKPVIATCFGGSSELVEDGVTGMIVNPLDTSTFTRALQTLLADAGKRSAMGLAGKHRVMNEFSLPSMAEAYCALFRGATDRAS